MAENSDTKRPGDEEDDDEEEIDDANYKTAKDAILFAVDISESMLQRPPPSDDKKADRDSPATAALKCAYQLMQQRIISHPNDMMGILLFGTEKADLKEGSTIGDQGFPHCYLLEDLDVPSAQDVKQLRDLVEDEEQAAEILTPAKEPVGLSTVLFCANQIFTTKAPNFSSRRLFLVTDNDNPAQSKIDKDTTITRARDLYDLGVIIELFPISRPGHGFDRSKFFDDLIYPTSPSDPDALALTSSTTKISGSGDGISLLQSLLSSINSKATPRRALFSIPFEIAPGLQIGVKGFLLIKRQEHVKSCYVWVGGEKPQIVQGSTSHLADDTARVVEKTELRKAYKFGGEAVTFSEEEFKQIRQCFGDPIIRIIGFKPMSSLPIWANTNKATFIYPSEADYIGSTRVFSALQQKLISSKKMGVAWFIPRRNAAPTIAAIIPGEEKYGDDGEQVMPPGLWLVPLPFADDLRQCPEQTILKSTDELTDIMSKVIHQLQLPKGVYDPSRYPNPDLQWFYRILQAMALEEELPDHPEDKTIPKYRQIDKRAGQYIEEFGAAFKEEMTILRSSNRGDIIRGPLKKRGADSEDAPAVHGKLAKRVKTEGKSQGDGDDLAEMNRKGTLSKTTVAVLKDWLSERGQSTSGKKADLIERVQEYLDSKGM
ncbi:DNA-dependent protein kinase [Delitschia confertaspora ATCC 74209]|uniref:ATP-dependent DNA helicase II subunit 1 n=1 Tax=Delitschia confertaspora ATCC 74209 TaxID=1513339 RepID=A0A9P4JIH2_9PLEO|nr:DNA-dependent protein kinase [Delitschia confertaspora ATCC 74209]